MIGFRRDVFETLLLYVANDNLPRGMAAIRAALAPERLAALAGEAD